MKKPESDILQNQNQAEEVKNDLKDYTDTDAISELLVAGKLEEAITYLKSEEFGIEESGTEAEQGQYCANIYLNAVFNYYVRKLQKLKTVLKLDIQIGEKELPYKELCQIIANGLENACNVARIQAAGEREVLVRMKCNGNCLTLRIKNRCGDKLPVKKGADTKTGWAERGDELLAIQKIVEKLDGVMHCYTETVNFVLDVLVLIKN